MMISFEYVASTLKKCLKWKKRLHIQRSVEDEAHALIAAGNSEEDAGNLEAAYSKYRNAVSLCPDLPSAHLNVGNVLLAQAKYTQAISAYQHALTLSPEFAPALCNLGTAYAQQGNLQVAQIFYKRALDSDPDFAPALIGFATVQSTLPDNEDAEFCFRRGLELTLKADPNALNPRWALAMAQLRPMYDSISERIAARDAFMRALGELDEQLAEVDANKAASLVGTAQPFNLAYHPVDLFPWLKAYGALCCKLSERAPLTMPSVGKRLPFPRKIRMGIATGFVHNHSVWIAITRGWVNQIDKSRFDICIFKLEPGDDNFTAEAKAAASEWVQDLPSAQAWAQCISEAQLDVLIYPEIGMHSLSARLASHRLVPIQMGSWGHPCSSGMPTIDYFLSSEDMEPPLASSHYTEQLVRLPHLGVYVEPLQPDVVSPDLNALGLPTNEPLILLPGMPFKYGPEHDEVWMQLARKLQDHGSGRMVFFYSQYTTSNLHLERRLRARFFAQCLDFDRTVRFIPLLPRPVFYGLMECSAVMADTVDFSGFNTAMQAMECDLPMVAYAGEFLRGRLCSALLNRLGLGEWVATNTSDFVDLLFRMATDRTCNTQVRKHISAHRNLLFRDMTPIHALENVLQELVEGAELTTDKLKSAC